MSVNLKNREIRCVRLRGATPEGGWSKAKAGFSRRGAIKTERHRAELLLDNDWAVSLLMRESGRVVRSE